MSESNESTPVKVSNTFGEVLGVIQPEPVRDMIVAKLDESLNLRKAQNARVYDIRASKESDPNSFEVQDATWKRIQAAEGEKTAEEKAITAKANRFDKIAAEYEKLMAELREMAKAEIKPPLTEDEIKAKRKEYNDAKPVVEASDIAAKTMAEMADGLLKPLGIEIEGGVFSLMPAVESLMGARGGRKSSGGTRSEGGYATRIGSAMIEGEDASKGDKYSWAILAEKLNARTNAKRFPSNEVTAIEIEEEFYRAAGLEFRDKENIPAELSFTFSKDVEVQSPNDDTTKVEPHKFAIHFVKWAPVAKEESAESNESQPA